MAFRWAFSTQAWAPDADEWTSVLSLLPVDEIKQIETYRFEKDRKLALGSRLLQRQLIHQVFHIPFDEIQIKRTQQNKPYYEHPGLPNWNFNVSHHGQMVGIASDPVCLIGLDIMDTTERPKGSQDNFFKAFDTQFTAMEWQLIKNKRFPAADQQYVQFYRQWSMKEAYIKAIGIGLGYDLLRVEFLPGIIVRRDGQSLSNWKIRISELDEKHIATVARGPPDEIYGNEWGKSVSAEKLTAGLQQTEPTWEMVTIRDLTTT